MSTEGTLDYDRPTDIFSVNQPKTTRELVDEINGRRAIVRVSPDNGLIQSKRLFAGSKLEITRVWTKEETDQIRDLLINTGLVCGMEIDWIIETTQIDGVGQKLVTSARILAEEIPAVIEIPVE